MLVEQTESKVGELVYIQMSAFGDGIIQSAYYWYLASKDGSDLRTSTD